MAAEVVVSTIVQPVVSSALEGIAEKAAFLHGVSDKVSLLQAELKRMQCFLKDADRKQEQDHRVRNYIAEIRDLAYDVEDTIDTFLLRVASKGHGISGFVKRASSVLTRPIRLHQVGTQIDVIRKKIDSITTSLTTYGIKTIGEGEGSSSAIEMQRRLRRSYPHYEEDIVVGLENSTRDLMAQLMTEDDQLRVVSVVGRGGLGKTTLAKKVYNHSDVKRHFDCDAWTFISQNFSTYDVLLEIVMKLVAESERTRFQRMTEVELVETLYNVLKERRYLVVLDDIWSTEAWDCLKQAFPIGRKGSKILFTTRIKNVATYADPCSSSIEPPCLTDEEGWALLSKKAFPGEIHDKQNLPPEFENMGKEMVKSCGGLPLAILVLGGMLVTKKSVNEWEVVQRNINAQFIKSQQATGGDYGGVHGILGLSFLDLPLYLKPCFLYLSQYPEDGEIERRDLVRMWIAEGFVSQPPTGDGDETIEDVGEELFEELISRCMVQVSEWDHTGKGVKTCRLHDLMRDVCVRKAREENFLSVIELKEDMVDNASVLSLSRRIAISSKSKKLGDDRLRWDTVLANFKDGKSHLRSLLMDESRYHDEMKKSIQIFMVENFRLLRVLKLNGGRGKIHMPTEIGYLIHLRYLGLIGDGAILPRSIGNLRSLRTLNFQIKYAIRLPDVVWKLERLRHLVFKGYRVLRSVFQIGTLTHLETLKGINAATLIRGDALHKLTNIRELSIIFTIRKEVEMFLNSPIIHLGRLHVLSMAVPERRNSDSEFLFPNLQPISRCHRLTKLRLGGKIQSLGSLEFLPASLADLSLLESELEQDPIPVLEKLPNLRILHLGSAAYEGAQMVCSVHGFPRLEILKLDHLSNLEDWRVEEGAMPCLKGLFIVYLPKLKMIPEGLKSITTIKELRLKMPNEFIRKVEVIEGVEGEHFHSVKHIPSITLKGLD